MLSMKLTNVLNTMSRTIEHALARNKVAEAREVLQSMGFVGRQQNDTACLTLLALLDLAPEAAWSSAADPLRGITPVIQFISEVYGVHFAPNTRETIRDDAVKHFVEQGLVVKNPDNPLRPTNSGKTVYQVDWRALDTVRRFGSDEWRRALSTYVSHKAARMHELTRAREPQRVPVTLPDGRALALSPGGQNRLIQEILERFCPIFAPGGVVVLVSDSAGLIVAMNREYLANLGVALSGDAKLPDVVVHLPSRRWLLLIEAVASAGPIDGKRRKELKEIFETCREGLVFVTAFATRKEMRRHLLDLAWESEVWIAEDPEHLIHFNGERFLGPYPDVSPKS